jgi:hypothetical protein
MSYALFIDDERFPPSGSHSIIARTSVEAFGVVLARGMPDFISFDHDLGGDDTAMKFLHDLADYALDHGIDFSFDYYIHSQNPIGAANIDGFIRSFQCRDSGDDRSETHLA